MFTERSTVAQLTLRPVLAGAGTRVFAAWIMIAAFSHGVQAQGLVPPSSGKDASSVPVDERHALLIGNSAYDGVNWRALPGVRYDIDAVSDALKGHGYDVEEVHDLPAATMRSEIERFIKQKAQKKNTSVIIYYAGHGVSVANIAGVEQGYLVPVDAPNPRQDSTAYLDALMPIYEFGNFSMRMQARHALFLFDACFAGTIFKDLGLERDDTPPPAVADLLVRPARSVITSGSAGQKVPDESYFRRYLVDALNGNEGMFGDGYLTGEELGAFLRTKVMNEGGGDQRPQFGKLDLAGLADGDFVFSLSALSRSANSSKVYRTLIDESRNLFPQLRKSSPPVKAQLSFMNLAYGSAESFDEDSEVLAEDKVAVWKVFLDLFGSDIPDTGEDELLRERAMARYEVWRKAMNTRP